MQLELKILGRKHSDLDCSVASCENKNKNSHYFESKIYNSFELSAFDMEIGISSHV